MDGGGTDLFHRTLVIMRENIVDRDDGQSHVGSLIRVGLNFEFTLQSHGGKERGQGKRIQRELASIYGSWEESILILRFPRS